MHSLLEFKRLMAHITIVDKSGPLTTLRKHLFLLFILFYCSTAFDLYFDVHSYVSFTLWRIYAYNNNVSCRHTSALIGMLRLMCSTDRKDKKIYLKCYSFLTQLICGAGRKRERSKKEQFGGYFNVTVI